MIYDWEATCKITLAREEGSRDTLRDAQQAAENAAQKLNTPKYRLEVYEVDGANVTREWVRYAGTEWKEVE